jgi:excisionase family DNA binding protein
VEHRAIALSALMRGGPDPGVRLGAPVVREAAKARPQPKSATRIRRDLGNLRLVGETGFEPATPWSRTAAAPFSSCETAGHGIASPGNPEGRSACQATQSTTCDDLRGKICRPRVASDGAQAPELSSEPLLSIKEVAARLGVCRAVAYRLCERGELPHVRISNAIRVSPAALTEYLAVARQHVRGGVGNPPLPWR